ncbi:MAG: 50S ribosomal protein L24e [Candidatus ainarchaeum sp.]|nr:50S ribosomal protein L24e [Candidatus ainarchaeum sp.]
MVNCSFCSKELKPGTGLMFVKKEGTVLFFCSRKCRMNLLKLKRNPANKKWSSNKKTGKR